MGRAPPSFLHDNSKTGGVQEYGLTSMGKREGAKVAWTIPVRLNWVFSSMKYKPRLHLAVTVGFKDIWISSSILDHMYFFGGFFCFCL